LVGSARWPNGACEHRSTSRPICRRPDAPCRGPDAAVCRLGADGPTCQARFSRWLPRARIDRSCPHLRTAIRMDRGDAMTASSSTELDIVIPVYNEGANIVRVLQSLREHVASRFRVLICYDRD